MLLVDAQIANRVCQRVLLLALVMFAGCSKSDPQTSGPTGAQDKVGETTAEKCRKKLSAAIHRLNAEELASQSNPERSINGLNAWLASCAAQEMDALSLDNAALEMVESNVRVTAGRFTVNDSTYIRDCLVFRDLTNAILQQQPDDTDGNVVDDEAFVRLVFDWVVRNISLLDPEKPRLPLGLFDVMLTGRGSAKDRAWIFAEALRQQQIDAFLVTSEEPPAAEGDLLDTSEWLVAVALQNQSFVFDMQTGLPVSEGDHSNPLQMAAIDINQLGKHARWANCSVQIIAQLAAFAPRMLVLQQQLAVEDSAVLFEELTGGVSEIRPILERIVNAGHGLWKADAVLIWTYPEQRSVAAQSLTEEQRSEFKSLMRPFDAPFERDALATESVEELTTVPEALSREEREALVQQRILDNFNRMTASSEEMFGKPSKRLLKTRIRQVAGADDTGVIQQLQQIRITSMESVVTIRVPQEIQAAYGWPPIMAIPFPQIIREVNQSSTGSALYWSALRQIELGDVGAAIITLMNYRRQYEGGEWTYPSMINQAIALLVQERTQDAVTVLKEADVDQNPERSRVQHMLRMLAQ